MGRSIVRDYKQEGWSTSSSARGALEVLQKYQQSKIPFANLYLHYSRHHVGTLDQEMVYEYLVGSGGIAREWERGSGILSEVLRKDEVGRSEREKMWDGRASSGGRGGTCTMNNGFFGTVMRSLGFKVKMAAARVAKANRGGPKGVFDGWNHLVNLVEFEGVRYLVDVGFVANGQLL
jgi:arylamine N-acetyltransferase